MAVFFFLLCSGICVMAFVKANRMSHLAQDTKPGCDDSRKHGGNMESRGKRASGGKDRSYFFKVGRNRKG